MPSRFTTTERLELRKGRLWRVITAHGVGRKSVREMDIVEVCEDGQKYCRNLYFNNLCGYTVAWPGDSYGDHWNRFTGFIEEWGETKMHVERLSFSTLSESDKKLFCETYPHFKYIINRFLLSTNSYFRLLSIWKEFPEVEYLMSSGYKLLSFNKSLWRLSEQRRKDILQWLRTHSEVDNPTLKQVQTCMKYGIQWSELRQYENREYSDCSLNYLEWVYIKKMSGRYYDNARLYSDYRTMCKKAGHSLRDPYWRYPKDLRKRHNKVIEECRLIDEAERARRLEQQKVESEIRKKEELARFRKFSRKMARFSDKLFNDDRISVFIPSNVEQVRNQADKLKQCLISCDYISKVVNGECLLVFIYKDNKPYATAELKKRGKAFRIGQFYGDERKKNCSAKDDARLSLFNWAEKNQLKIVA